MKHPSYYAIIPANVRYDSRLKANEKILFAEITALSNANGYCNASNAYFSNLYNVSKETVSRWVRNLKKCGYLSVEVVYKPGTKEIASRRISLLINSSIPIDENINTLLTKKSIPIDKKVKENNTSINNTSIIKEMFENVYELEGLNTCSRSQKFSEKWAEWIEYKKDEFGFKYKSDKSIKRAILDLKKLSGGDVEHTIELIDYAMTKNWKGFHPIKKGYQPYPTPKDVTASDWDKQNEKLGV